MATVVSRYFLGNHPAFPVPEYELVSPLELVAYMIVGVVAALVGLAFIWALYKAEDFWEGVRMPDWLKASVGGAAVGTIAIAVPNVYGVGYSTITQALAGTIPATMLGVFLVSKIAATSITIGSGGSGGVFAPSLFLGAMTGGLFGTLIHQAFPDATASSGAYALVTMGAVVAATTHAPIAAILMIFELTQSITIIPPLMAACVVSTLVATFLRKDSIYTLKLRRRGVDIRPDEDPNVLKALWVRDIIDREPEVVPASANLERILTLLVESDHTEFFVVNAREELIGPIYLGALRRILLEQDHLRSVVVAGDLVESGRPTVTEDDNLDVVMQIFSHETVEEIGVVDPASPRRLVGSVHKRDVINALNQETMRRDLAGGVSSTVAVVDKVHEVELGGGYLVKDVLAPARFVGRSLRELNIRANTGVHVLLIRSPKGRASSRAIRVPTAEDVVEAGDTLIVAGSREALETLE